MATRPRIGLFDSGIGGLSVLSACLKLLPDADFFYYGDNLRAPYGSRAPQEIAAFTGEAFAEFASVGVDVAVIACNTATAVCLEEMRRAFSFPVVGVEPAVACAARSCSRVLVLATPVTSQSDRLRRLIGKFPGTSFTVVPVPGLASAVEAHFIRGEPIVLAEHLPARGNAFDGAVLGCTHYSLIKAEIAHFLGIPVFDGGEGTARRVGTLILAGTDNHLKPQAIPNNCLSSKWNKKTGKQVFFLGNGRFFNREVFDSNICFSCI